MRPCPPCAVDSSDEVGGSGKFGFSVGSGLCEIGAVLDRVKICCEVVWASTTLQLDCESGQLFGNHSRCETSSMELLLVVHDEPNSGPEWTWAIGSNETVRPFLIFL